VRNKFQISSLHEEDFYDFTLETVTFWSLVGIIFFFLTLKLEHCVRLMIDNVKCIETIVHHCAIFYYYYYLFRKMSNWSVRLPCNDMGK